MACDCNDAAPGFQGYMDTRMDLSDVIVWSRRYLVCRKCEAVQKNDGTSEFAVDWARALLESELN